jgi:NAD(P)-dependent dehydrogenase (short-subunit alcohol dehydrogenase family)
VLAVRADLTERRRCRARRGRAASGSAASTRWSTPPAACPSSARRRDLAGDWEREMSRNAETVLRMSRAALPLLRESRGAIVNFASPAGRRAVANLGAYSAAKAAVIALTRALALEEKEHGVRVNAIAPGTIDTEQNRESMPDREKRVFVPGRTSRAWPVPRVPGVAGISGETIHVLAHAS